MIRSFSVALKQNTTPHAHRVHELVVGSSGEAVLCVGGTRHVIAENWTVLVPANTAHHYELAGGSSATNILFVCFDDKPLERYLTPATLMHFRRNLMNTASSAWHESQVVEEITALVKILGTALQGSDSYCHEKAGNTLSAILVNHFTAIGSPEESAQPEKYAKIKQLLEWINENLSEEINIENSAARTHMSRSSFTRCFKQYTNQSLSAYVSGARLRRATDLLSRKGTAIDEVAYQCGFNNLGHFYKQFHRQFGMTPKQYRSVSVEMRL